MNQYWHEVNGMHVPDSDLYGAVHEPEWIHYNTYVACDWPDCDIVKESDVARGR